MSDLESRVKALEDWQQALALTFLSPPKPTQQTKFPAQAANEATEKREADAKGFHGATTIEGDVCPKCGGPKKPNYNQCYKCWEKSGK